MPCGRGRPQHCDAVRHSLPWLLQIHEFIHGYPESGIHDDEAFTGRIGIDDVLAILLAARPAAAGCVHPIRSQSVAVVDHGQNLPDRADWTEATWTAPKSGIDHVAVVGHHGRKEAAVR